MYSKQGPGTEDHERTKPLRTRDIGPAYLADPNTNPIDRSIGLYDVP
jgi:hypothetical protein